MRWPGLTAAALIPLALPTAAVTQELTWSGQIRPRFESRDPGADGTAEAFTTMRTRLSVAADLEGGLSIFVQPQDVRTWGEETHPLTDFSAGGLDVHQAYMRLRGTSLPWLTTTLGRMEARLGGERLLGAVDWTPQAQAFDGVRLDVASGSAEWSLLAYQVSDEDAPGVDATSALLGVHGTYGDIGPGALDVYWLYDHVRAEADTDEHLIGARYAFDGALSGRVEATFATGSRADDDVSAFMVGARAGTTLAEGRLRATLWYDYLSGDDPSTPEVEVFQTLFATNHKFYGFADLFTNIPAHTGAAGLQDMAVKLRWTGTEHVTAALDVHTFRAAEGSGLADTHFGEEVDVSLAHRYTDDLTATFGLSRVFQAAGLDEVGRLSEDMTWLYVMVSATF